ncbi:hypothetical protein ERJ75_001439800 [Trypanosoma vivax]|uniref:Uncharacterized protein n=1 Tax=Trypanosoma vivax (strain Y486) TaxID=1055687 RepID=F9WUS3_TRYVY|nr:hypothetical protein TRVL_04240 [Trypanosoma vivax]KAH8607107.1 hypothetical protein ERJ75_001439800 [Trypanosoma vivax]CCD21322.1 hypothetical protein TvY486_0042350 [Trypanosoma vivax Y486]|eukprot:CCD21322.1 hypothetical protein TvY486_0042350 [Trypanosoma vivax Y486]
MNECETSPSLRGNITGDISSKEGSFSHCVTERGGTYHGAGTDSAETRNNVSIDDDRSTCASSAECDTTIAACTIGVFSCGNTHVNESVVSEPAPSDSTREVGKYVEGYVNGAGTQESHTLMNGPPLDKQSSGVSGAKRLAMRRVRWADEDNAGPLERCVHIVSSTVCEKRPHNHQKGVASKQQLQFADASGTAAMFAPPIRKTMTNTDGRTYISFKTQNTSRRFVPWKECSHTENSTLGEPPFKRQPMSDSQKRDGFLFFSRQFSPYRFDHYEPTVRYRVASLPKNGKNGGVLDNGGLQMPLASVRTVHNSPVEIPFTPSDVTHLHQENLLESREEG